MNKTPEISVIMACYNHEKYIEEAIQSILSQSYSNFELIVIDDGSTDKSRERIGNYDDPRIRFFKQHNRGPSSAINAGFNASRGDYIALMSSDDISVSDRLETQIAQLKEFNLDAVFSPPEIIGINSENLDKDTCPWFFGQHFTGTPDLLQVLFFEGNFICAPSFFCRREVIEQTGEFHRGLLQLQDMDYWIRVCKGGWKVKNFNAPVLKYRYLFGQNLSSNLNYFRIKNETQIIFRNFFKDIPEEIYQEAFKNESVIRKLSDHVDLEISQTFLYLQHQNNRIKEIGIERIIEHMGNHEYYERLVSKLNFSEQQLSTLIGGFSPHSADIRIRELIIESLKILGALSRSNSKRNLTVLHSQIRGHIQAGDYKRAISMARVLRKKSSEFSIIGLIQRTLIHFLRKLKGVMKKISAIFQTKSISGIYELNSLYEWSKQKNLIAFSAPPEEVFIPKPSVFGNISMRLEEGMAMCPPVYISKLSDAYVTGGSGIVIMPDNTVLSDELFSFSNDDYGIKSRYILYTYQNKVLVEIDERSTKPINEGILLATDHDLNYFHWIVEVLPKLLFVNTINEFRGIPLLVTEGLHNNMLTALKKINVTNREIINLKSNSTHHVSHLIVPSGLSRINDRYSGSPIFGQDMVFSNQWLSHLSNKLRINPTEKPWRKLYLTRKTQGRHALLNSNKVEELLIRHGYEAISLENATFDYQLNIFSQAKSIIAPTGAALTNLLFCQPGTEAIIFMSNQESTNYYLWSMLGTIAGVNVKILVGERSYSVTGEYSVHDNYSIPLDLLEHHLKSS